MKIYELVCVIDASMSSTEIASVKEKVEKMVTSAPAGKILTTDDMGLMPLAHPLDGNDQAYFLSYHIEVDPDALSDMKMTMKLEKGLSKFVFYSMRENEEFLTFSTLQKEFDALVEAEEARKQRTSETVVEEGDEGVDTSEPEKEGESEVIAHLKEEEEEETQEEENE